MKEKKYTDAERAIARRLKELRISKGMSLDFASEKIGISKVTLYRYENLDIVNIPFGNIEKLAKLYGTIPEYIMGWFNAFAGNQEITPEVENYVLDKFSNESVKTAARNQKMINKFDKLSDKKKKIVENLIDSYFDEEMEDEE